MAKEEIASNRLLDIVAWLDANRKQVLIGGGIFIVVVGGLGLFFYQQAQKEVRASEVLSEVRVAPTPNGVPPAGTAEAFLQVANKHSGTKAGERAIMEAAGTFYVQGRYADAQREFDRLAREYPGSEWLAQAGLGAAGALEAQGKIPEAVVKYDEVRKRFANSTVVDMAKLSTARLYEQQNRPADALRLYEELVKLTQGNPYSALGNEAGMRMEELLEKHPELIKTNVPPPSITQMPTPGMPNITSMVQTIMVTNQPTPPTGTGAPPQQNVVVQLTNPVTPPKPVPTNVIIPANPPTNQPPPAKNP